MHVCIFIITKIRHIAYVTIIISVAFWNKFSMLVSVTFIHLTQIYIKFLLLPQIIFACNMFFFFFPSYICIQDVLLLPINPSRNAVLTLAKRLFQNALERLRLILDHALSDENYIGVHTITFCTCCFGS